MADYIDREKLTLELIHSDSRDIVNKIYALPSVDAVEVVRCKRFCGTRT